MRLESANGIVNCMRIMSKVLIVRGDFYPLRQLILIVRIVSHRRHIVSIKAGATQKEGNGNGFFREGLRNPLRDPTYNVFWLSVGWA